MNFLNFGNPQKENWWEESFFFDFFEFVEFFEFFEFWQSSKRKLVGRVLFFFFEFFEFVEFFEFLNFRDGPKFKKIKKFKKKTWPFFF